MAIRNDITTDFFRGEDKVLGFTIIGSGTIAGWTLRFIITATEKGLTAGSTEAVLYEANEANGKLKVIDAAARKVDVTIPAAVTDWSGDWKPKPATPYFHSLKRTDADAETVLEWGTLTFTAANQVAEPAAAKA
jgi:hypothetical protein